MDGEAPRRDTAAAPGGGPGPARLGIAMLDTRFPRPPGDVGNPATWPFPVRYRVVRGARAATAVGGGEAALLEAFVEAGRALVGEGCTGLATTCGFLVPLQDRLSAALGVPVASSSLMQVPAVAATLPPGRVPGVVTISRAALAPRHRAAAGIGPEVPVAGTDEGATTHFTDAILGDADELDQRLAQDEVVAAARRLIAAHPEVGAIVLECTNMGPYAAAVQAATGLPAYSIVSYLTWFHAALAPPRFGTGA
jgi:hypothetical protein